MSPLGVILAGGRATRMGGGDKALLPLAGRPMLDHVLDRLRPQVAGLALNANGDPARFAQYGLPVLPDGVAGFAGPLAGVLAGLDWAAGQGAGRIVTVAGDTPFFPADLVARLTAAAADSAADAGTSIALAATPEAGRVVRHPTFGLWPVALRDDLRDALTGGLRKVVLWTDRHGAATALFDPAAAPFDPAAPSDPVASPFFNVNTPDDLAAADLRARAHRAAGGA